MPQSLYLYMVPKGVPKISLATKVVTCFQVLTQLSWLLVFLSEKHIPCQKDTLSTLLLPEKEEGWF